MVNSSKDNPHLTIPDFAAERKKALDDYYKAHPELIEVDRLCYELFIANKEGDKLLKTLFSQYVEQPLVDPTASHAANSAVYWAGFTDCLKNLRARASTHLKRIQE